MAIAVAGGIVVGAIAAWLVYRVRPGKAQTVDGEHAARPEPLPPSITEPPVTASAASAPPATASPPSPCLALRKIFEALPSPDMSATPIELTDAEIDALPPELPLPVRRAHRKTPPRARRFDRL
jgi:hypothetical protein